MTILNACTKKSGNLLKAPYNYAWKVNMHASDFKQQMQLNISLSKVNQRYQWKSDLFNEIKRGSFHAVAVSILLYWCTTQTIIKYI